jgi:hypothetical protein
VKGAVFREVEVEDRDDDQREGEEDAQRQPAFLSREDRMRMVRGLRMVAPGDKANG